MLDIARERFPELIHCHEIPAGFLNSPPACVGTASESLQVFPDFKTVAANDDILAPVRPGNIGEGFRAAAIFKQQRVEALFIAK